MSSVTHLFVLSKRNKLIKTTCVAMNEQQMNILSDCTAYAHFVFNTFDQDHSGTISFEVSIHFQTDDDCMDEWMNGWAGEWIDE